MPNALQVDINPTVTTTYTLTVSNGAGSTVTATVTINVITPTTTAPSTTVPTTTTSSTTTAAPTPASITYFFTGTNSINLGESTYLWAYYSGTSATVDQGIGAMPNALSVSISPTATTTYTLTVSNGAGSTVTATATVTVVDPSTTTTTPPTTTVPPSTTTTTVPTTTTTTTTTAPSDGNSLSITLQPTSNSVLLGNTNTFSVTASATGSLSYQWQLDGVDIAGATSRTYVASTAGAYTVVVTSTLNASVRNLTSTTASLTLIGATITGQPTSMYVTSGISKFLNVGVSVPGGIAVTYQWYRNNSQIVGATSQSYSTSTAGDYFLVVTSSRNGATLIATSSTVTVTVVAQATISNFSPAASVIYTGTSTTFTPVFTGSSAYIMPGNIAVNSGDTVTVSPTSTTTYTLNVSNLAGTGVGFNSTITVTTGFVTASANDSSVSREVDSTSVTLVDGRVLIFGNRQEVATDVFDPTTNRFTRVGNLNETRRGVPAIRLTNGKVLAIGGDYYTGTNWSKRSSAELFDPSSNTWSLTGSMSSARGAHFAVLLNDGRVLVGGGRNGAGGLLNSTEIYDPSTGLFTPAATMPAARAESSVTLLPNGNVLLIGGVYANAQNAEVMNAFIYDVASNTWSVLVSEMNDVRSGAAIVAMQDGRIIIGGGWASNYGVGSIEIFDPTTNSFVARNQLPSLGGYRGALTAHLLQSGKVAFFGGSTSTDVYSTIVVYDPTTNHMITEANTMTVPRYQHSSTVMNDGRVFIIGGNYSNQTSADIFTE